MFYFVVVAALANFIFNLFFIPAYGFIGASISTTLGFFIYTALLYISSFKHTKWIIPWKTLIKVGILTVILAFITIQIKMNVLDVLLPIWNMMIGLTYFLIYIILIMMMGEFPFFKKEGEGSVTC